MEVSVVYRLIQQVVYSNCANLSAENLNTRKNNMQMPYTKNPNNPGENCNISTVICTSNVS
jgi:hypothetical protein